MRNKMAKLQKHDFEVLPRIASSDGSRAIISRRRSDSIKAGSEDQFYILYCVSCWEFLLHDFYTIVLGTKLLKNPLQKIWWQVFSRLVSLLLYHCPGAIVFTFIELLPMLSIPSEINNVWVEVELVWFLVNQPSLDADCLLEENIKSWTLAAGITHHESHWCGAVSDNVQHIWQSKVGIVCLSSQPSAPVWRLSLTKDLLT